MKYITREECPNTRVEFIAKWESDPLFKARAYNCGFRVICGNVVFPNGKVATPAVK
jgi:hypothetical protein